MNGRKQTLYLCFAFILFTFLGSIPSSAADCSTSTPGVNTFRPDCQYMCHCKYGAACDATTGECTQGCDTNWFGPACQYRDLADKQYSRHNSNQSPAHYSFKAHDDGDTSTCSYTQKFNLNKEKPWWRVWLPQNETIRDIYIQTQDTHRKYFRSFKVTVEYVPDNNKTDQTYDPTNVRTCYQHNDTIPEYKYIKVHCDQPVVGNQVRIKLSSIQSQLVLCDVRIGAGRNFAFRKSVTASSQQTSNNPPLNAVDGRLFSSGSTGCFVASNTDYKYLDINLGNLIDAYSVNINTSNADYIKDYQIYTATTGQTGLQLAHDDTGTSPPVTYVHIDANIQQLRIQTNSVTQFEICEIQIFGECPANKCGYDCSENCYCKLYEDYEHRISGVCSTGCQERWTGSGGKCNIECDANKWGTQCQNDCGACRVGTCAVSSGLCTGGCEDGYRTTNDCKTECPDGKYGEGCGSSCSAYCSNTNCIKTNGVCTDGCKPGYKGDKCDQECPDGTYGVSCGQSCSTNCKDVCNHVSGTCTACKPGWKGNYCDTECQDGTYGQGCGSTCSEQCMNGNCIKTNGVCIGGCKAGYTDDRCDQECPEGTYGINCAQACSANCEEVCDHELGTCEKCKAGWKGNYCNRECDDGKYGTDCAQDCVSRCGNACDKVNGHCSQCQPGWKGDSCETECINGRYGINCVNECSDHCVELCNKYNGSCSCSTGWRGDTCHDECEDGTHGDGCANQCGSCKDGLACDKINGSCTVGCAEGYKGSLCASKIVGEDSSPPIGAIAGACSAIVVIAIVVVVVMLIIRRRRKYTSITSTKNTAADSDDEEKKWQNVSSDVSVPRKNRASSKKDASIYENSLGLLPTSDKTDDAQPQNINTGPAKNVTADENYYAFDGDIERPKSARAIMVKELANYVKSRLAQQNFFENEFNDIPYGLQYPTLDAKKPGNMGKNRYKAMYAYDHSRVSLKTLPSEPHSDYINASYIKGYKKDRAYIAAQGPTVNNVADFWRMIWENDLQMIAMVTNLVEETKTKCLKYWMPVGKSKTFGKITVHTVSEEEFAEFSVRRFQISYEGEEQKKNIVQYAYTAWPDKDVPNSTCSLLHFWQKVRKQDNDKSKPWLVHCSAGVGRTGTFIALDFLYDQGIDTGYVDINMCVRNLRDQRVNMVQMKDQYSYLYRIMVEALVLRSTPISMNEFDSYYSDLLAVDTNKSKTQLMLDFKTMEDEEIFVTNLAGQVNNGATDKYTNAKIVDNKAKNRYSNILAADEFRPFLSTHVPGTNNYINAVYMPSYNDLHGYLMTQTPLPDTAVDCCRLIIEQEIHVIVTFDDAGENTVGVYLPTAGSIDVGPFKVTFKSEDKKDGYMIRRHTLRLKSKEQEVVQLEYRGWPSNTLVPEKPLKVLQMLHEVDGLQRQFENKPVLAQCFNGAERSGLFVVLMNVIERARIDDEVSIPQVIRYLRTRRQIIPNYEQYKFCHDVFLCYAESNSTYANM